MANSTDFILKKAVSGVTAVVFALVFLITWAYPDFLIPTGLDSFTVLIITGFGFFLLAGTFALNKLTGAKSYVVASMLKSERIVVLFDKFVFLKPFFNLVSDAGLVVGFGLPAVDNLFLRKFSRTKRLVLNAVFFLAVYSASFNFFSFFSGNPLIGGFEHILALSIALFGLSGFILISLVINAFDIVQKLFLGVRACPGIAPLIPGIEIPGVPFFVPWHGWISLFVILVIHEGFHGVLSRISKISVKSAGLIFLGLLPVGAFVEPNEKQLVRLPEREQLRIFAAGAAANIFSAIVFLLIAVLLLSVVFAPVINGLNETKKVSTESVIISSVSEEMEQCGNIYSFDAINKVDVNSVLLSINGEEVRTSHDALAIINKNKFKEVNLQIVTPENEEKTVSVEPNEIGLYGFTLEEKLKPGFEFSDEYKFNSFFIFSVSDFLNWLIILSFLLGLVNFLPLSFFDGGRISTLLLSNYFFTRRKPEERKKAIEKTFFILVVILLFLNALPLFI